MRALLGVGLLVVVAAGTSARHGLHLTRVSSPVGNEGIMLGVASAVLVGVTSALRMAPFVVARGSRKKGAPSSGSVILYRVFFVVATVGVALAAAWALRHQHGVLGDVARRLLELFGIGTGSGKPVRPVDLADDADALTALVIAAVLATALIAGALVLARRADPAAEAMGDGAPDDEELLAWAEAVRQGSTAMADIGDPRAAIIACYEAMRLSLQVSGVGASVADTPTEISQRAAAAGAPEDAARTLTHLFLEARFSVHVMTGEQRQAAVAALAHLAPAEVDA